MRFLRLTISALGPYPGKETIDFSELEGLTLVFGNTGCGKTFLFDAVTFALYGETSGKDRPTSTLKSSFAGLDANPYVELVFEHNGKEYTINRIPAYIRRKQKGQGTREEAESVYMLLPDGRKLDKKKDVKEEVVNLTGLTAEQWRQVVMLAQGQFERFLQAESGERGEILESIFGIGIYSKITQELQNRSKEASNRINEARMGLAATGRTFRSECPEYKEYVSILEGKNSVYQGDDIRRLLKVMTEADSIDLQSALDEERKGGEAQKKAVDVFMAAKSIEDAFAEAEAEEGRLNELASEKDAFDVKRTEIMRARDILVHVKPADDALKAAKNDVDSLRKDLAKAETDLESATAALGRAKEAEAEALKGKDKAESLSNEAAVINDSLSKYESLDSVLKEIAVAEKEHASAVDKAESSKAEYLKTAEKVDTYREYLHKNSDSKERYAIIVRDIEAVDGRIGQASRLLSSLTAISVKRGEAEKAEKVFTERSNRCLALNEELSEKYALFVKGQAGILAAELHEGLPCPVCGSVSHPRPASRAEGCPTSEEIDGLRGKLAGAEKDRDEARDVLEKKRSELGTMVGEARSAAETAGIDADPESSDAPERVNAAIEELRSRKAGLASDRMALEAIVSKIDSINTYFEKNKDPKAEMLELKEAADNAERKASERLSVLKAKKEECSKGLPFASRTEAEARRDALTNEASGIRRAIESSSKARADAEAKVAAERSRGETLRTSLDAAEKKAESCGTAFREALSKNGFDGEDAYRAALRTEAEIKSLEDEVSVYDKSVSVANGRLQQARERIAGRERPADLEELKATKIAAEETFKALLAHKSEVAARKGDNARVAAEVDAMLTDISRSLKDSLELQRMAEVAYNYKDQTGTIVSFAEYVQSRYFDSILALSARRLEHMTGGRYVMRRIADASGERKSHLLDLEIIDNDSPGSGPRPASSLSGGESFKASLALALGLSDAIKENAAGQKIDALFIDEGFGTLDEDESLDQAIDVLEDLSGSSKTVLIISHVQKLRERIPRQVVVEYTQGKGSSLSVIKD
ncbi:MAG: hypothetical protein E7Z63_02820 [Thermoplasmata archaeon]|nr:hypothetical protein [Thermoplasmata archaeon]